MQIENTNSLFALLYFSYANVQTLSGFANTRNQKKQVT